MAKEIKRCYSEEVDLQVFIENNINKRFGDIFIYGDMAIHTCHPKPSSPFGVIVYMTIFIDWDFRFVVDSREIDNGIKFYKFITEEFLPKAEASYKSCILMENKKVGG